MPEIPLALGDVAGVVGVRGNRLPCRVSRRATGFAEGRLLAELGRCGAY
jgi:hypothetical protein